MSTVTCVGSLHNQNGTHMLAALRKNRTTYSDTSEIIRRAALRLWTVEQSKESGKRITKKPRESTA